MVQVFITTTFKLLHDRLGMIKVSARWMPIMLTPPKRKKQQRIEGSRAYLDLCNEERDAVLSKIVTGNETWVHSFESGLKQNSRQWRKKTTKQFNGIVVSLKGHSNGPSALWRNIINRL